MSAPTASTLDESISETFMRDVRRVGRRMKMVLMPGTGTEAGKEIQVELRNWDLWGPLCICLALAVMLSMSAPASQAAVVFCIVFGIVWLGAAVVTLNAQLLDGNLSFFQSVCMLGYCVSPLAAAGFVCEFISWAFAGWALDLLLRAAVLSVGFGWATRASVAFLSEALPPRRRMLAVYPVLLFYLAIAWLIFIGLTASAKQ